MKILFISTLYPSSTNPGAAPYNRALIGALARTVEVRVMAPSPWFPGRGLLTGNELPPVKESLDGIELSHPRVFYTPGLMIHRHWSMYAACIRRSFFKTLDEFKPDHVIAGFAYPDVVAVASLCAERGIPYCVRVNGSDFRVRITQKAFCQLVLDAMTGARRIFCPGNALRRDIIAAGVDQAKIVAFMNGVDGKLFTPSGTETPVPRQLLYVGHFQPVKGPDRLVESMPHLIAKSKENSPTLVMVGEGPLRRRLEKRAAALGIEGCIMFPGDVSHAQIPALMRQSALLCIPSRSEGMPNVAVEALACGLPVVGTDVGELPFMIRNGRNGSIISNADADDPARLADCIHAAMTSGWDRMQIAAESAATSWDDAAAKVLRALQGEQR